MTLWDLLTILSGGSALGGALAAARVSKSGLMGYVITTVVGICLGVACVHAARSLGNVVGSAENRTRGDHVARSATSEWWLRLVYAGAAVWILASGFLGMWIGRFALGIMARL